MGSGSSKPNGGSSSAAEDKRAVSAAPPRTEAQTRNPSSSKQTAFSAHGTRGVTQETVGDSSNKPSHGEQNGQKGSSLEATDKSTKDATHPGNLALQTMQADGRSSAAGNRSESRMLYSARLRGSRPGTASEKRMKSARLRRNDTKNLMRKMEMGVEDEEDVDNILGLDKMKNKMLLKREKTIIKMEEQRKHRGKFQNAAIKVQSGQRGKFDGPKTEQDHIYMGNMDTEYPSIAKLVRIFTSSTFTDTMHERNKLMESGYPRVKAFCKDLGYDFQVVDMRWGVRDQATDDHMAPEMCLRELEMCQKLSTGPNFVSLMSHKYGYTDFPRVIPATEFDTIMPKVQDADTLNLFKKWYSKDMNAVPAVYVAHPVSVHLPDFIGTNREKKDAAKKVWYEESEAMQSALEQAAVEVFDANTARKYVRSVTETEVYFGILAAKNPKTECVWLRRSITDIENIDSSYILSRYMECTFNNDEDKVKKSREMLKQVKDEITQKVSNENVLDYTVKWDRELGVNPKSREHQAYLNKLNEDFVTKMCSMIQSAADARSQTDDPVLEEVVQHIQFCQEKCRNFHGRTGVLKKIKEYIQGMSNEPLVLHGASGSGKTSIMSMAAMSSRKWCNKQSVTVLRFIGTTPDSSNLVALLTSITSQIRNAYHMPWPVSKDVRTLTDEFALSLFLTTTEHPLLLVLDSLDMLDPSHNARQLHWLPTRLRPNVKVIVSTLPEPMYEAFPVLQSLIRVEANIVEVPTLTDTDFSEIIDKWLERRKRCLTPDQKKLVISKCKKCTLPLYLKLSFDKACTWASFSPKGVTTLEPDIRRSIDELFARLETVHGQIFVSKALGYLTISKSGLTETELEDILSCDDDVLNDVYMYWTPPIRRLPPLLLVRLRADLDQYLVERGADNVRVMYWYHRQFVEAAENRYCNNRANNEKLHAALADFFAGTWADGKKKAYTSSKGEKGSEDRHVATQPNAFGHSYNLRKIGNLPYHRCQAKQLDALKKESLCNFEFLLDKLKATNLWQIMDDFTLARKYFPNDDLINNIDDVIHLAQVGLLYDPHQLVPQIIGRLPSNKTTESFLKESQCYPLASLLPDKRILTQPGGQLKHSMAGHKGDIIFLDITADSTTAMSCSDDGTLRLWSIETGQQIQMYDGLGKMTRARFCCDDKNILVDLSQKLTVRARKTGEKVFDLNSVTDDYPSCLCGENKSLLVVFQDHNASVFDLADGSNPFNMYCSDEIEFKFPGLASGTRNFAAVTTSDQVSLTVLDLKKRQFSPLFRGFEPFIDQELGDEVQHEIDELTFTADEKFVLYSSIYTNDIIFLDFRNHKKVKCIKGNPNDYLRSLKCSPDNKYLYYVKGPFVTFHDMKSSADSTEELEHTVDVICACTNDMKTVITSAEDSNVRVWDRSKKQQIMGNKVPAINANRIRMLRSMDNARYLVGFGFKTRANDSQFIFVYDAVKHCSVRERMLDCSILHMELINEKELLIVHDVIQKLKVVNMETLKVTREFQGFLSSRRWAFKLNESKTEVYCLSCGRHNVKVYNIQSGKICCYITSGKEEPMDGFVINASGSVIAGWNEDDSVLQLFDRKQGKMTHTIRPDQTAMFENDMVRLTPDGKYVLFKVEGIPAKSKRDDDIIYIQVWSTDSGKKVCDLVDMEYHRRYCSNKDKSGSSAAVDMFEVLDNNTVLSAHDDFIMRVFNIQDGTILHLLTGHNSGIEISYNSQCSYILTHGCWTEEMSLRVWDKDTFTSVASYTLDRSITNLKYSSDNKFILATTGKPAEIVKWRFNHFRNDLLCKDSDYPEAFSGKDLEGYLDLVPDEDSLFIDPDDPDKDMDENCDEDDDDDFL